MKGTIDMTDNLRAPAIHDRIKLEGVVLSTHTHHDNKYYGTGFVQVRIMLEGVEGVEGVAFGDLRLTVDADGKWFGPQSQKQLRALQGEDEVADDATGETTDEVAPIDDQPLDQMSHRQLDDYARANGLDVPPKGSKAERLDDIRTQLEARDKAAEAA